MTREEQAIELLKEVIALHGFPKLGRPYRNGLVERGQIYMHTTDGKNERYANHVDGHMMLDVDEKIMAFLENLDKKEG